VTAFVSSPLAAVLVAEVAIRRALLMLPFAVLIAAVGVRWLFSTRPRAWRAVAVLLLALVAVEFSSFRRDYFSDYRNRSGVVGGNMQRAGGADPGERTTLVGCAVNGIPFATRGSLARENSDAKTC
jgi:hypothetical protein